MHCRLCTGHPSFQASPQEAVSAQALGTSAQSSLREAMPDSPQGTLKEGRGLACISKFAPKLETLKCLLASVLRWQER